MPLFDYTCTECKETTSEICSYDKSLELDGSSCESCRKGVRKKDISVPAPPIFTGSGFYETDYKKKPR